MAYDFSVSEDEQSTHFVYARSRLMSFKKVDSKWHVTAGFSGYDGLVTRNHRVTMTIDDETGEATEMTSD